MDKDAIARLGKYLGEAADSPVEIKEIRKLPGGAIQENWLLDIAVAGGEWSGDRALVLRRDAKSSVAMSHGRAEEFALLKAAHKAGVTVPMPCLMVEDSSVLGGPFFIMHRVEGTAAGHRVVKKGVNEALAADLGVQLARIHTITPGEKTLRFLPRPKLAPSLHAVAEYRCHLDDLGQARPALEWGLRWLELNAPGRGDVVLCHRDFRTGNYMVSDEGGLTGILDWEFSGWGDREEDIGWFMAKCWRFGAVEREAGGIAPSTPFLEAYEKESGRSLDPRRIAYWQVMSHVRWAVIACQQAARHVSGGEESLELAMTQHIVPELELEVLALTEGKA